MSFPVEVDRKPLGHRCGALGTHALVKPYLVGGQADGVFQRFVIVGKPVEQPAGFVLCDGHRNPQHAARGEDLPERTIHPLVRINRAFDGLRPVVAGAEHFAVASLPALLLEVPPKLRIGRDRRATLAHVADVLVDPDQRAGGMLCHVEAMPGDFRRAEIQHGILEVADDVRNAENGVVLRVHAGEVARNRRHESEEPFQLRRVQVLQGPHHFHGALVFRVEHDGALLNPAFSVRNLAHDHIVAGLVVRVRMRFNQAGGLVVAGNHRHLIDRPEIRVRVELGQSKQRNRNAVLFAADDGLFPLHGDVGQNIHHRTGRAGPTLGLFALDREPLPDAHGAVFVLAHQWHVVVEHIRPAIGRFLRDQPVGYICLPSLGDDRINARCRGFKSLELRRVKVRKVVARLLVGHSGTAIRHGRVALGNQRIGLFGMARVQVLIHVIQGKPAHGQVFRQRRQFGFNEIQRALCCAAVEQRLLKVRIPLVGDLAAGGTDGLYRSLGVDMLVLKDADQVVELAVRHLVPSRLAARDAALQRCRSLPGR